MKRVTLTFDNGPDESVTPGVLDALRHHGIRTTFFVVGQRLALARAAAERAHAEGHWIGNHTWSHTVPFRERGDPDFVREEIDRTQVEIGDLSHPRRFFRPYGGQGRLDGALNPTAVDHLERGRFTCVLWNAVPGDFKDFDTWPETALRQIEAENHPLVVLHDVNARAMSHLDRFLNLLKDSGHEFDQEFPTDCIALIDGVRTAILDRGIVAQARP